jgi:hypothetical protein
MRDDLEKAFVEILKKQQLNRMKAAAGNMEETCHYETTASTNEENNVATVKTEENQAMADYRASPGASPTSQANQVDHGLKDIDPFPTTNFTFDSNESMDVEDLSITRDFSLPLDADSGQGKEKKKFLRDTLFSRKTLLVVVLILLSFILLLVVAVIFRSKRPTITDADLLQGVAPKYPTESPTMAPTTTAKAPTQVGTFNTPLLTAGQKCDENDHCESGLCSGMTPPYYCQPKRESCGQCNEDRNCEGGHCVRRSGQSVCASGIDGLMKVGCFCDVDEHCISHRCEGDFPIYTCKAASTSCSVDTDCPSGVCNFGQCSDNEMGAALSKQPLGDHCSGHEDCSSGICVGSSMEQDGVCTDGSLGSQCTGNDECKSDRCILGSCSEKQVPGGACGGNNECASAICIGWSGIQRGVCLDSSEKNKCTLDVDCESGICEAGFCKTL